MQELTLTDTLSAHDCQAPSVERWHVFEPVTARWSWLTIYRCCSRVSEEPAPIPSAFDPEGDEATVQRAA